MRVLEVDPSISYTMGKNRKHRIRKSKENEADESSEDSLQNGGCPHVTKAVNLAAMRKVILKPTVSLGECSSCSKEAPNSSSRDLFGSVIEGPVPAAESDDTEGGETTICVCLQCGHQGCDRNSLNKHAIKHYKIPHSSIHCLTVNLTTWATWCYICDDQIPVNGRIQPCIDFLQKQFGVAKTDFAQLPGRPLESPDTEASPSSVNSPTCKSAAPISCIKVKGLNNLGNTCFFNAVMQSICQTRGLESLLLDRTKPGRLCNIPGPELGFESDSCSSDEDEQNEEDLAVKIKPLPNIQTSFGDPGAITLALLNLVQEMKGSTTKNGTVNPTALFTQVCKKAPRFKGFQQQDSHELLRYLVDCIRTEEIKRGQASILKFFKLPESISPKKVDEETKVKVKEYGRQVKHTFLDSLFGGQLVSTVKCEECKTVSQICEAFLDLSLPVMEEKPQRPNLILIGKKRDSVILGDVTEEAGATANISSMGLDTYMENKPSKYQERKSKRLAKKDSKRKSKCPKAKSTEPNDSGGKGDNEDKQDIDAGSDEGNPVDMDIENNNENKQKDLESPESEQTRDQGGMSRQDEQTGSGHSSVVIDSSPEGSKDGVDANENEDDTSDADVEDNIESDILKLECTATAEISSRPHADKHDGLHDVSLETKGENETCSVSAESVYVSKSYDADVNTNQQELIEQTQRNQTAVQMTDRTQKTGHGTLTSVTLCDHSQANDKPGSAEVRLNGQGATRNGFVEQALISCKLRETESVANEINETPVVNLAKDRGTGLLIDEQCSNLENTNIPAINGIDGSCISCEVSVKNSQVIELTNGVGRLTISDSDGEEEGLNKQNLDTQHKKGQCDNNNKHKTNAHAHEDAQVSATFSFTLPANNGAGHGEKSNRSHSTSQSEVTANVDMGDVDIQIRSEEKHQAHMNVLKTQQEYLKDARNYSMNTLAPRYHPSPKECSILSCLNQFTAAELLTGSNKFGCKECSRRKRRNSQTCPAKTDKKLKDTVYSNANKQYLIFRPPAVLTLHLKRFEQTGITSRKVNRHVDFPCVLDLAPYCSSLCLGVKEGQSKVLYSLYGVVEHSGRLSGGHYTAYIKVRPGLGPPTQFLHTNPPGPLDLLNVYLTRVIKSKESGHSEKMEGGGEVDRDIEAMAETLAPPGRWFHISDSRVNEVAEAEVLRAQAYLLFYERIF
ncbi:unnamed protein product [Lymnaea stagnalis]|uniref:ubiquitinyl hydrolase 1 n=1 Tax=Lymnaea stagnalis TaxID=6523 RepID=A0AAV2HH28_LYMST